MAKPLLDVPSPSASELRRLLWEFGEEDVLEATRVRGGYSGSNYAVLTKGRPLFLKCANGQSVEELEYQVAALRHLNDNGVSTAVPQRLRNGRGFVTVTRGPKNPTILLSHVSGANGETIVENRTVDAAVLVKNAAAELARIHVLPPLPKNTKMRTYLQGGCCNLADVVSGRTARRFVNAGMLVRGHPFLGFFASKLKELQMVLRDAKKANLPQGLLHGDPFLDNAMFDEKNGKCVAWIDWEDVTTGYLIWDVACGIIGCCYEPGQASISMRRVDAFLSGYQSVRSLENNELALLGPFLRGAILCNAAWRFENFNITHRATAAKDAYKELVDRYDKLEKGGEADLVERKASGGILGLSGKRTLAIPSTPAGASSPPPRRARARGAGLGGTLAQLLLVMSAAAGAGLAVRNRRDARSRAAAAKASPRRRRGLF